MGWINNVSWALLLLSFIIIILSDLLLFDIHIFSRVRRHIAEWNYCSALQSNRTKPGWRDARRMPISHNTWSLPASSVGEVNADGWGRLKYREGRGKAKRFRRSITAVPTASQNSFRSIDLLEMQSNHSAIWFLFTETVADRSILCSPLLVKSGRFLPGDKRLPGTGYYGISMITAGSNLERFTPHQPFGNDSSVAVSNQVCPWPRGLVQGTKHLTGEPPKAKRFNPNVNSNKVKNFD